MQVIFWCYSNCGHPPGFLLRRDGTLERLESTSRVIGLFEQWDCAIDERQLQQGDTLVLYTDGAAECSNHAGEELGEEGLLEALKPHREFSSQELLAEVTSQVGQFSAYEQADGITFIVAKCT